MNKKSYELTDDELKLLTEEEQNKYRHAIELCHRTNAGGPQWCYPIDRSEEQ